MPARDLYHEHCKNALMKNEWNITNDPLKLKWGSKDMYVDLAAEKILAAEKLGKKIAVEIKSFIGASAMKNIEMAIGQYFVYRAVMAHIEPDRKLYLAIHKEVFLDIFEEPIGKLLLEDYKIPLIVFDVKMEELIKWIE